MRWIIISLEKYRQIFHEFADDVEFIDENIKKLELNKDCKILDIGTGIGAMSTLLALNGFSVITGEPEVDPETESLNHHNHHYHNKTHDGHQCEQHKEHNWSSWNDWRDDRQRPF